MRDSLISSTSVVRIAPSISCVLVLLRAVEREYVMISLPMLMSVNSMRCEGLRGGVAHDGIGGGTDACDEAADNSSRAELMRAIGEMEELKGLRERVDVVGEKDDEDEDGDNDEDDKEANEQS
jgi:hypothetical protein